MTVLATTSRSLVMHACLVCFVVVSVHAFVTPTHYCGSTALFAPVLHTSGRNGQKSIFSHAADNAVVCLSKKRDDTNIDTDDLPTSTGRRCRRRFVKVFTSTGVLGGCWWASRVVLKGSTPIVQCLLASVTAIVLLRGWSILKKKSNHNGQRGKLLHLERVKEKELKKTRAARDKRARAWAAGKVAEYEEELERVRAEKKAQQLAQAQQWVKSTLETTEKNKKEAEERRRRQAEEKRKRDLWLKNALPDYVDDPPE